MTFPLSIDQLRADFESALDAAHTRTDLKAVRDHFLSRKHGLVTALVKAISSAPLELRPTLGAAANAIKREIEQTLETRELELMARAAPKGAVDVSLPGRAPLAGR